MSEQIINPVPPQVTDGNNHKERKTILIAELVDGKVEINCYIHFIPTLSFIKDWLQVHITKLFIQEEIKREMDKKIANPNFSLMNYLRGTKPKR